MGRGGVTAPCGTPRVLLHRWRCRFWQQWRARSSTPLEFTTLALEPQRKQEEAAKKEKEKAEEKDPDGWVLATDSNGVQYYLAPSHASVCLDASCQRLKQEKEKEEEEEDQDNMLRTQDVLIPVQFPGLCGSCWSSPQQVALVNLVTFRRAPCLWQFRGSVSADFSYRLRIFVHPTEFPVCFSELFFFGTLRHAWFDSGHSSNVGLSFFYHFPGIEGGHSFRARRVTRAVPRLFLGFFGTLSMLVFQTLFLRALGFWQCRCLTSPEKYRNIGFCWETTCVIISSCPTVTF